ncbi:hypothetical protein HNR15_003042 [Allobranchiibius huperziae]|uniref:Uncharacterized protein n=1 Tax=Allobranchiibius huperziae TaxID=1874116 RepID=A0A853DJF0_9MICO|nr:hypothetical protein [Allobranchiibius huperziae]
MDHSEEIARHETDVRCPEEGCRQRLLIVASKDSSTNRLSAQTCCRVDDRHVRDDYLQRPTE